MLGSRKHVNCVTLLDDPPIAHDKNSIAHVMDDSQIVRYEEVTHTELIL
jgi:hypothetical protein